MPPAIQIETQAEQQRLSFLHGQGAARCTSRKFALHRREQGFDQRAAAIDAARERSPHLGAHSLEAPGFLSALGGDHTVRSELLPDVGVISLAVELGVGQHQSNAGLLGGRFDHGGPGTASRDLRQQKTADPDPPRSPTSTNAAREAAFAREDAGAAQRRC